MKNKKLSIVVPNYNNEKYLKKCIECLLQQTYKNVEIIVVNDGSKGKSDEIMATYSDNPKIKYVKHDVNKGLFQARLTGASNATGDYITFLDADDYVSIDYYRTMMRKAEETNSDMVISRMALEYDSGKQIEYKLFEKHFESLNGKECIDQYFKQKGLDFSWHTIWNKIYSKKLWDKAAKHYGDIKERLVMTEDFAFSTVLFYYCTKITQVQNDRIFYCQHDVTSTSIQDITFSKAEKNIHDMNVSFTFVENFMKKVGIYDKYKEQFNEWKHLYANQHRNNVKRAKKLSKAEKEKIYNIIDEFCDDKSKIYNADFFYTIEVKYNDKLEKIKQLIASPKIKCVSFDIFDTLITRPFYEPLDMFRIMDKDYRELTHNDVGINFSKIRVISENICRENKRNTDPECQEVTLDEIYDTIHTQYEISKDVLEKLKKKECEYEIRFCKRRDTIHELYELALDMGKKVIFTSDMYLPEDVIVKILKENGYTEYTKLYLSSTVKKIKWTGDLYRHVFKDMGLEPGEMIHMGDNFESDYKRAKELGMNSIHIPKTIDVMTKTNYTNNLAQPLIKSLPFWRDNAESIRFMGIRCMMAVVANKLFDNPFKTFDHRTDFNSDPYLIGYYALGMYVYGVTKWILDETNDRYDKVSFMARDGYLILESYKIMKELYSNPAVEEYLYVSRKALIPVMIVDKLDFYKLSEIIEIQTHSPKNVIKYVKNILDIDEEKLEKLCKEQNISYTKKFQNNEEFNRYIKILVDNFYDEARHKEKREKLKEYFNKIMGDKPATFDVGYSGRPEFYLTHLCGKSIDTLFLNINRDDALEYSKVGNFKLKTYFEAKPTATGNAYELLFSKLAPSCIGYNITEKGVEPVFEKYENSYQVEQMVGIMQKAAIEFVSDIINIFKQDTDILYYQDYYITLPIMSYFNSATRLDKRPLDAVEFEDTIRTNKREKMIDSMQEDLNHKNQRTINDLYNNATIWNKSQKVGKLDYNPTVDLNGRNKFVRLLYYALFDRTTLKRRIRDTLKIK
ncbi:putative uncharacterized protein [Clostridium sp. CAG:793]|nr:putative uncharacterized protein [Clostridium sp. CAG:793]